MSSKISELIELNAASLSTYDFVTVANTLVNTNYKVKLVDLFSVSLSTPATESFNFIGAISSSGTIVQKGLVSQSDIITLSETGSLPIDKIINIDVDLSKVDLSLCDNTNSGFLTAVDVDSVTGTLAVANGGTGKTSFTALSVLTTQDSGDSAIVEKQMDGNGELLIGGSSGPEVATLTAGDNITITNGDGSIEISSEFTVATQTINMDGYNIDLDNGWINGDGSSNYGLTFNAANQAYIGNSDSIHFELSLNVGSGISLSSNGNRVIQVEDGSNPGYLRIIAQDSTGVNVAGGNLELYAGAGNGSGDGGNMIIATGGSTSGDAGSILFRNGSINSVTIDEAGDVTAITGDVNISAPGKGLKVPYEAVVQNTDLTTSVQIDEVSGIIVLAPESIAAGAQKVFTLASSLITGTSKILLNVLSPSGEASVGSFVIAQITNKLPGTCQVRLFNAGANNSSTNSHILHYLIVK